MVNDVNNSGVGGFTNQGLNLDEDNLNNNNNNIDNSDNNHRIGGGKRQSIQISRSHYNQRKLHDEFNFNKPEKDNLLRSCLNGLCQSTPKEMFLKTFPIVTWISTYNRELAVGDLISGITVAIMHIPQGMGYALLAEVPPIVGIYMAFFPVLLYSIFGTSKHNSMGTFAVIAIMVGKTVSTYTDPNQGQPSGNETSVDELLDEGTVWPTPIQIATVLCFSVGVIHLVMYVLRLGVISFLLSETLVSGFTTGAAFHVLTSQIKDLLGLRLASINGNFKLIFTYIDIFKKITTVNFAALIISVITISILIFNNEWLKPRVARKTKLPIPIELIVVVGGTLISRFVDLNGLWSIRLVGTIPTGFPPPEIPDFSLVQRLLVDSFAIAMVSYSVSVSMALIFAQKLNYEIDFNQELLAMGSGNILGSFFSCFPFSTSLSRSLIQQQVGGRTQMTGVISCSLLLVVLLWIGPFFEQLPRCILASVVVVALKGMLWQVVQFFKFKKQSTIDGLVWLATFLAVVIVNIDIGLLVGIVLSVICIFVKSMRPYVTLLGNVPNTDLYLDINHYDKAVEIPRLKIFRYCGNLNFATKTAFRNTLCETLNINLTKELKYQQKQENKSKITFKNLIIDFASLTYIDASSVNSMLNPLIKDFNKLNIKVCLAGCTPPVMNVFNKCKFPHDVLYPTVHDAVIHLHIELPHTC